MTEDAPLATLTFEGGRTGLHFERVLHHPVERVWQALTSSQDLRHWMPADIVGELAKDAEISLPFWPEVVEKYQMTETVTRGKVDRWEPPRAFGWTWDTDELLFELEPVAGLTAVQDAHAGDIETGDAGSDGAGSDGAGSDGAGSDGAGSDGAGSDSAETNSAETNSAGSDSAETGSAATRLVLSVWLGDDSPEMLINVAAGYHVCLDLLAERLDSGQGRSTVEVDPAPFEELYAEHLAF